MESETAKSDICGVVDIAIVVDINGVINITYVIDIIGVVDIICAIDIADVIDTGKGCFDYIIDTSGNSAAVSLTPVKHSKTVKASTYMSC